MFFGEEFIASHGNRFYVGCDRILGSSTVSAKGKRLRVGLNVSEEIDICFASEEHLNELLPHDCIAFTQIPKDAIVVEHEKVFHSDKVKIVRLFNKFSLKDIKPQKEELEHLISLGYPSSLIDVI